MSSTTRAGRQPDMTDTDRKIACGDLDEDVDDGNLPECARHLGEELPPLHERFPLHDRGASEASKGDADAMVRDAQTRERVAVPSSFTALTVDGRRH